MKKDIAILLPYKENFSPIYPGAVSLFVHDTSKISKFKKYITIYGNTNLKKIYKLNYKNIFLNKNIIQSGSRIYVKEFLKYEKKNPSSIIEIHNRPNYFHLIYLLVILDQTAIAQHQFEHQLRSPNSRLWRCKAFDSTR